MSRNNRSGRGGKSRQADAPAGATTEQQQQGGENAENNPGAGASADAPQTDAPQTDAPPTDAQPTDSAAQADAPEEGGDAGASAEGGESQGSAPDSPSPDGVGGAEGQAGGEGDDSESAKARREMAERMGVGATADATPEAGTDSGDDTDSADAPSDEPTDEAGDETAAEEDRPMCPRHPDVRMVYANGKEHYHDRRDPHWRCELWIGSGVCGAMRDMSGKPVGRNAHAAMATEIGAATVEVIQAGGVTIAVPAPMPVKGLVKRAVTPRLTPDQARVQNGLFQALQELGTPGVRRQQDVYGWLLEQIGQAADGEE